MSTWKPSKTKARTKPAINAFLGHLVPLSDMPQHMRDTIPGDYFAEMQAQGAMYNPERRSIVFPPIIDELAG